MAEYFNENCKSQRTEHRGTTCQGVKVLNERKEQKSFNKQSMCDETSSQNDAYKEAQYECIVSHQKRIFAEQSMYCEVGGKLGKFLAGSEKFLNRQSTYCKEGDKLENSCPARILPQRKFNGCHREHPKMKKQPARKSSIKNVNNQRTEHRGRTYHDGKPGDEQNTCNKESNLRHYKACKKTTANAQHLRSMTTQNHQI